MQAMDDLAARRACDQCRLRKIRCDKEWPCSNCRTASRGCTSTGAGQRPKEQRQRVLISSQYERKIDQIESRLGTIESLLRAISPSAAADKPVQHTPEVGPSAADFDLSCSDSESVIGGESGLTVHTTFASDFIERAVRRTSLRGANHPKMETALTNLRHFVDLQKRRSVVHGPRFPLQQPIPEGGVTKLPMPPMASVISLLKQAKASHPTLFTIMCSLVGVNDFASLCRSVYFPTEDISDATFVIVNSLLYNLFIEQYGLSRDPSLQSEYSSHSHLCRTNLETTLASLPLFLSAKVENVQALLLGCLYAVDVSRPSVALQLISMAAWLCQSGHYHRKDSLKNDPPAVSRVKKLLFWHVYSLDKGLGLRLGHASSIPECDIDIPREFEADDSDPLATNLMTIWIQSSWLQSQIYEQLYSPAAMACPQAELVRRAHVLAEQWSKLEASLNASQERLYHYLKPRGTSDVVGIFLRGDEVQFNVTKTLIYRVIPAPEGSVSRFCHECLEAARKTMLTHQECINQMDTGVYFRSIYIHWNLLSTPFAPFFVLFCFVIETSSYNDLKVLQDFVDSIDVARSSSEPVDRLYRLCQAMCDVAVVYVETKSQQQKDQSSIAIGDEFDMYLSQLGFMPIDDQAIAPVDEAGVPLQGGAQMAQHADWFSGSRNMMGLLEEDLSRIDSFRWMQSPDQM